MIVAQDLVKTYATGGAGGTPVLHGVDLHVRQGSFCTILGPSGSGKSTLLSCLSGLEPVDAGSVRVGGRDVHGMSRRERDAFRRDGIGFVFQDHNLIGDLTLLENIGLDRAVRPEVEQTAHAWGIGHVLHHFPAHCSGGQRQKAAILRALNKRSDVLFCDEPTGALDAASGRDVLTVLQDLSRTAGVTVVMITHNEKVTAISDHVVRLRDGRVTHETRPVPADAREVDW
ncbi:ABC transporter ATP-binding protein [Cellulomonas sp.]|uniref:ABC transporter ATP-binding protein n=1 Tax=Cellulomonas sp. TaxID=40001 RepID=UPI002810B1F9|nr:ABC transporter ATP-binding protein [Cellulomonas sp.]